MNGLLQKHMKRAWQNTVLHVLLLLIAINLLY